MANWSIQNTITTSIDRTKDGIVKLYVEVQLLYGKLNAMRTFRNTGTAPSDAIAKEVWVDNNTLKRRTDDNGDWVVLEASPVDGSASDAKIGNRTINQTLASPANAGPLTSLLSWLAGAIVAITGKTYWYDTPSVTLEATKMHIASSNVHGATTASTASTLVLRDTNGDVPSNAVSATKLKTTRTISLSGDATGSVEFDGSANASIAATLANSGATAGTYKSVTIDAKGRVTAGTNPTTLSGYGITDALPSTGNAASAAKLSTPRTINGVAFDGTANITINAVDSTARVASSEKGVANGVATLDASGTVPAGQLPSYVDDVLEYANLASFPASGVTGKIYVAIDTGKIYRWSGSTYIEISPTAGTADSATKLATARIISLSGDATGSATFDGSANAEIALTLANSGATAGTYAVGPYDITVDTKGRVTSMAARLTAGDLSYAGTAGVTVSHTMGTTNYTVNIMPTANTNGDLGDVFVSKAANAFTVYNTGGFRGQARYQIIT